MGFSNPKKKFCVVNFVDSLSDYPEGLEAHRVATEKKDNETPSVVGSFLHKRETAETGPDPDTPETSPNPLRKGTKRMVRRRHWPSQRQRRLS